MTVLIVFVCLLGLGTAFSAGYLSGWGGHIRKMKRDRSTLELSKRLSEREIIDYLTRQRPSINPPSNFFRKDNDDSRRYPR